MSDDDVKKEVERLRSKLEARWQAPFTFMLFVFAAIFIYCVYGAVVGHLRFPSRHSELYLSGLSAWCLVAGTGAFVLYAVLGLGVINVRLYQRSGARLGYALMTFGAICVVVCRFLPGAD